MLALIQFKSVEARQTMLKAIDQADIAIFCIETNQGESLFARRKNPAEHELEEIKRYATKAISLANSALALEKLHRTFISY